MLTNRLISNSVIIILFCTLIRQVGAEILQTNQPTSLDTSVKEWLTSFHKDAERLRQESVSAQWNYSVNAMSSNAKIVTETQERLAEFRRNVLEHVRQRFPISNISDPVTKRMLTKILNSGLSLDVEETDETKLILNDMIKIYNSNKICSWQNGYRNCSQLWSLENDDLMKIFAQNRDYEILTYIWNEWRETVGRPLKPLYANFVNLTKSSSTNSNYANLTKWWTAFYETENFTSQINQIYYEILPFYENLHTYVRRKLTKYYATKFNTSSIPAHILGDLFWSTKWDAIYPITVPYPDLYDLDITGILRQKNYTVKKMTSVVDDYFVNLGLAKMSENFLNKSVFEKPSNRSNFLCQASAWDFCNGRDFRIKMCANVSLDDLVTLHHEMGHVQYYMAYAEQPLTFRTGANPGFHEGVGDLVSLSVDNPVHLQSINLLNDRTEFDNKESNINFLYKKALSKIPELPFAYMMDAWKLSIFNRSLEYANWNRIWWDFVERYQGLAPPTVSKSESETDFDAAANSQILDNTPRIKNFVSNIIQFQFFKSMCQEAKFQGSNLHKCDFSKSVKAGRLLKSMMTLGSSVPWSEAMKMMTNQPDMSGQSMLEYFLPLIEFLKKDNEKSGDCYGWGRDDQYSTDVLEKLPKPRCPKTFDKYREQRNVNEWLSKHNAQILDLMQKTVQKRWLYATNVTKTNMLQQSEAESNLSLFKQQARLEATKFNLALVDDISVARQVTKIRSNGLVLNFNDSIALNTIIGNLTGFYGTAKICAFNATTKLQNCSIRWSLEPDLISIMANSRDYELLTYIWKSWRDTVGRPIKGQYRDMVKLSNKGAVQGKYDDTGEWWRSQYEDADFEQTVENLWYQLLPLYEQLHTYVRKRLLDTYPGKFYSSAIPAHILGNVWAQDWSNIFRYTAPYPDKVPVDITETMRSMNLTSEKMFQLTDQYFQSLGFLPLPENFYNLSLLEKPIDRNVICRPSAWDFYNGKDYRIKMCTTVDMENFMIIHEELGRVQYFMQYANQSMPFREGANPGFHQAVGGTIALSVLTQGHLQNTGLFPNYLPDYEQNINLLYKTALKKIAFLPFGYLVDLWRWNVFNGSYDYKSWNDAWVALLLKYQGIRSPVERGEDDFDPGSKYSIPANNPYMSYFVSNIIQFQFYQAMCQQAKFSGDLHKCDFYNNKEAGKLLADMLKLGSSQSWFSAIKMMTESSGMNASSTLEYFAPLHKFLQEANRDECFGWGHQWPDKVMDTLPKPRCNNNKMTPEQENLDVWLNLYNTEANRLYRSAAEQEWAYYTNISVFNQQLMVIQQVKLEEFTKDKSRFVRNNFNLSKISNSSTKRQLEKILDVKEVLSTNDSAKYKAIISEMKKIIETAYVCNISRTSLCDNFTTDQLRFNPELRNIMLTSTNYSQLLYYWTGWRNKTGRSAFYFYKQYLALANKGATAAGYKNFGQTWIAPYEDPQFQSRLENIWFQILPLYEQLHTFVRRKLSQLYQRRFQTAAIPAHILGSMWGDDWSCLIQYIAPYPDEPTIDVTDEMKRQNYTPFKMFKMAEDYFSSLGLYNMTESFWNKSMLERPKDPLVAVNCMPRAENFFNGRDYAIKMCTNVDMQDFVRVHREMGRIEYFMSYADQPLKFRESASPAFDDAIGDAVVLSMSTPSHLHKIGLLPGYKQNDQQDINFLLKLALEKISRLPFTYINDLYRWRLFEGAISLEKMNEAWWELVVQYQGLAPPTQRQQFDFDAGSKYQILANTPYIQDFLSTILQFQFYSSLCNASGHKGPLYQCNFYNNSAAGNILKGVMKLGSSVPWLQALSSATNVTEISAESTLKYFEKLTLWLQRENALANDCFGWGVEWPKNFDSVLANPRCNESWGLSDKEVLSILNSGTIFSDPMIVATVTIVCLCFVALTVLIILVTRWRFYKTSAK